MSETVTMTVTEFLLARIAEDEADARLADTVTDKVEDDWQDVTQPLTYARTLKDGSWATIYGHAYQHIARHDPARVLAECAAKRRIVENFRVTDEMREMHVDSWVAMRDTLRALASAYVDHPDYDEAWKV